MLIVTPKILAEDCQQDVVLFLKIDNSSYI